MMSVCVKHRFQAEEAAIVPNAATKCTFSLRYTEQYSGMTKGNHAIGSFLASKTPTSSIQCRNSRLHSPALHQYDVDSDNVFLTNIHDWTVLSCITEYALRSSIFGCTAEHRPAVYIRKKYVIVFNVVLVKRRRGQERITAMYKHQTG